MIKAWISGRIHVYEMFIIARRLVKEICYLEAFFGTVRADEGDRIVQG